MRHEFKIIASVALTVGIVAASVVATCHRMAQGDGSLGHTASRFEGSVLASSAQGSECCMFAKHVSAFPSWVAAPVPPAGNVNALLGLLFTVFAFSVGAVIARIRAGPSGAAMAFAGTRSITPQYLRYAFARGILHPKIYHLI